MVKFIPFLPKGKIPWLIENEKDRTANTKNMFKPNNNDTKNWETSTFSNIKELKIVSIFYQRHQFLIFALNSNEVSGNSYIKFWVLKSFNEPWNSSSMLSEKKCYNENN